MTTQPTPLAVATSYFTALAEGRVSDALDHLSPTVRWFQPGENQFSGTHDGIDSVKSLLGGMMAVSGGSFAIAPVGRMMCNGETIAVPVRFRGERPGFTLAQSGIDLLTVREGTIVDVRLYSEDPASEDSFWGPAAR